MDGRNECWGNQHLEEVRKLLSTNRQRWVSRLLLLVVLRFYFRACGQSVGSYQKNPRPFCELRPSFWLFLPANKKLVDYPSHMAGLP